MSKYRVRLWSGQVVDCIVLRSWLFFKLVIRLRKVKPMIMPDYTINKAKWYPSWRVFKDDQH